MGKEHKSSKCSGVQPGVTVYIMVCGYRCSLLSGPYGRRGIALYTGHTKITQPNIHIKNYIIVQYLLFKLFVNKKIESLTKFLLDSINYHRHVQKCYKYNSGHYDLRKLCNVEIVWNEK